MATVKRLNTTYTINAPEVIIDGNLTVINGSQTIVETTDMAINDNLIILNNGELGAGVTKGNAGIVVYRGPATAPAVFGWDETIDKWVISSDGITFANIAAFTGNTGITAVVEDTNPTLGGNLDTQTYKIYSSTNNVKIDSNIQINHATVVPTTPVAGSTLLYADAPAGGTAGLFVVNASTANEELITKTRAFGFSLIL